MGKRPLTINIVSISDKIGGQGVGSAFIEQSNLVKTLPKKDFIVLVNSTLRTDIVHCHSVEPQNFVRMKHNKGVNVVHCHLLPETLEGSIKLPPLAMKAYSWYLVEFYKQADWIVVVNPTFIPKLEKYGIPREKVRYIPNFVSDKMFHSETASQIAQTRKKYNIPQDKFVVIGVGQVQTRKGVLDFVEIARHCPDMHFVWCGGFSFGAMTDRYEELKKVIENPPENVQFTGIIKREEMNDFYNACDVFFMPSYNELFPMCILEAASVGKPMILRDLDLYPDILFGNYAAGHSNDEFAALLQKAKNEPTFYRELLEKSERIHEFYCEENVRKQWADFYRMVGNSKKNNRKQK